MRKIYLFSLSICFLALVIAFGPYMPHPKRWPALINKPEINWAYSAKYEQGIAVIIPTYNDGASLLSKTLRNVIDNAYNPDLLEIVVVDGGSSDDTMNALNDFPQVKAYKSSGGRGPAINTGIEQTNSQLVLMLHSDCILQDGYDQLIQQAFADPRVILSAYEFDPNTKEYPNLSRFSSHVNSRSKNLWLPYGDQALSMRRDDLDRYFGGRIPNHKMMEDFELVIKSRDIALDNDKVIAILPQAVISSPRRFLSKGLSRTTALNWLFVTAYVWGKKTPDQIFAWYYQ